MMIRMKLRHVPVLTLAAVRVLFLGWTGVEAADHTKDSLETVKQRIADKKAVLIDVRELKEWNDGHIKGAMLAPLTKIADSKEAPGIKKRLPKDKILYIHCKSGGRCRIAADLLKDDGFDLRPLKAGYVDLIKAGFEKAKD